MTSLAQQVMDQVETVGFNPIDAANDCFTKYGASLYHFPPGLKPEYRGYVWRVFRFRDDSYVVLDQSGLGVYDRGRLLPDTLLVQQGPILCNIMNED